MNLAEWRSAQVTEATLPSGLEVKLKKATVVDLAQSGRIPETIRPAVDQMLAREKAKQDQPMTLADLEQFAAVVDVLVTACLVEPDGLDVAELPFTDRQAIFLWANEASAKLATFRTEQGGALEAARARK
jgi:hypothetical protein